MSGTASTVCHTTAKTNRNKNTRGYRAEQANPGKEMCMNHQNDFLSLPEMIRENCRFCCWRKEHRNGTDTKVPYTPTSGNRAKSNDVKTFCSFEQALTAYNNSQNTKHPYSGLGICVDGNIGAIDIDHCLDADGNLNDVATAVLGAFNDCYFEVSPSGTGLRGFFQLSQDFKYDMAVYYTKNSRYGLEIYLPGYTSRFVTVTGNTYREGNVSSDMDALQVVLDTFMLRVASDSAGASQGSNTDNTDKIKTPYSYLTDEQVLAKAYASANGSLFKDLYEGNWQEHADKYPSQSEADMAFAAMLAFWCGCDFEQMNRIFESSGLYREKWDRAQSGSTYGAITLANAIKRCTETYCPSTSAAEDFTVLDEGVEDYVNLMDNISDGTAAMLRLGDQEAVEQFTAFLNGSHSSSDFYADTTIALVVRTEAAAPHLYDELRGKARKNGVRIREIDRLVRELRAKVNTAKTMVSNAEATSDAVPPFITFNPNKGHMEVNCPKLAAYVREHLKYVLVQDAASKLSTVMKYVYEDGCYHLCSDDRMKGYIKKFITDYDESFLQMKHVDEVYKQINTDLNILNSTLLNQDENIINFQNGILNLDTMELQPHSPDILSTIQIPCNWNGADAPTPVFDSFMDSFTEGREDVRKLLLQFMGVCISNIKGWRLKKALFLIGEGDTGKSQLKGLTERLLGAGNHIGIDLDRIEARFGTSAIYGKRLAGSSDMKFLTIKELEVFKQCTGGDALFAEFKGLSAFHFIYDGLLWFCANRAPKFGGDQGDWVYDRMMIINCHNVIPVEKRDRKLLDKLYAEREGIVYKAVMALKEVIANGYRFDEPDIVKENRHAYKLQNNSVLYFFEECMQERPKPGSVPRNDRFTVNRVYDAYRNWCNQECDGYSSKFSEFKTLYGEYCGKPLDRCIGSRNGGNYLLFHELAPEVLEENQSLC